MARLDSGKVLLRLAVLEQFVDEVALDLPQHADAWASLESLKKRANALRQSRPRSENDGRRTK